MDRRNFIRSTSAIAGVYMVADPMRSMISLITGQYDMV